MKTYLEIWSSLHPLLLVSLAIALVIRVETVKLFSVDLADVTCFVDVIKHGAFETFHILFV